MEVISHNYPTLDDLVAEAKKRHVLVVEDDGKVRTLLSRVCDRLSAYLDGHPCGFEATVCYVPPWETGDFTVTVRVTPAAGNGSEVRKILSGWVCKMSFRFTLGHRARQELVGLTSVRAAGKGCDLRFEFVEW